MIGLSACGAPAYNYVADDPAGTYYKVPVQWHQLSQKNLDAALTSEGLSGDGIWSTAFDGASTPAGSDFLAPNLAKPFVWAEVGTLSSTASAEVSYNMLRDFMLPVSSSARSEDTSFPLTGFKSVRDQTITAAQGVHGVRETFEYTFPTGQSDTFDEDSLTNADQTVVYYLLVHCTNACYEQNQNAINTVMTSFTIGSPT
ncbi:MAG: hypothetical protein ABSA02_39590 [Trebonia sp.]|jgi:hypothetical protein